MPARVGTPSAVKTGQRGDGLYLEFLQSTARLDGDLKQQWKEIYDMIQAKKSIAGEPLASAIKKQFRF